MNRWFGCAVAAVLLFAPGVRAQGGWFHPSGGGGGQAIGYLFVGAAAAVTSPFWLPPVLLKDKLSEPGYFPGYPYARESARFIDASESDPQNDPNKSLFDPEYLKPWSLRLSLENGNDFSDLNRLGGQVAFDTASRFGLQTKWNYYYENLVGGHSDETVLGDMNLTFRFAQADWIQMFVGLGGRIQADRQSTRGGFNCLYGFDIFLVDPVVFSTSMDVGNLDRDFVFHGRATLGWQLGRFELYGGYDFLSIGSVYLQGPLAGVRLTF